MGASWENLAIQLGLKGLIICILKQNNAILQIMYCLFGYLFQIFYGQNSRKNDYNVC